MACEISTCNEVVVTELLFENALTHLEPEEIVALLSSMVRVCVRVCECERDIMLCHE